MSRRLDLCPSVWDLRVLAQRRVPRMVFDYVDGAAMTETSLERARESYRRVELHPHVLRDVADVDTSAEFFGVRHSLPFVLAPTGFTRMMHDAGEPAVARAAGVHHVPYTLSTLGTTSIEDVAHAAPGTRRWFQLYVGRDRDQAADLLERAGRHGYDTVLLTVDTAVGGIRRREVRHGLTIPPRLTPSTIIDIARHPRWWSKRMTSPRLSFAAMSSTDGTIGDLITRILTPSLTCDDLQWLRDHWSGSIIVKGVQRLDDARMVADHGADGIVLSNHGGRQIDMGAAPLDLVTPVTEALGSQVEVFVDGGILTGTDIVAALALGARGVLIGRAYLYGLMAGGEAGVDHVIRILEKEIRTTLQLLGVRSIDDLRGPDRDVVRLRPA